MSGHLNTWGYNIHNYITPCERVLPSIDITLHYSLYDTMMSNVLPKEQLQKRDDDAAIQLSPEMTARVRSSLSFSCCRKEREREPSSLASSNHKRIDTRAIETMLWFIPIFSFVWVLGWGAVGWGALCAISIISSSFSKGAGLLEIFWCFPRHAAKNKEDSLFSPFSLSLSLSFLLSHLSFFYFPPQ